MDGATKPENKEGRAAKTKGDQAALRENIQKWGEDVWKLGWTGIPYLLLEYQAKLKLNSVDLNVLMHLLRHWWQRDKLPYVSKARISEVMDVEPRTVQRSLSRLRDELKLIESRTRKSERGSNLTPSYSFNGLIAQLEKFAKEESAQRMRRKASLGPEAIAPTDREAEESS